jgi:hypothetical protein
MVKFIPVRYLNKNYPTDIKPQVQEITANFYNFNKHKIKLQLTELPYISLHTDPGYRGRKDMLLSSDLLSEFRVISENVFSFGSRCVSKLWFNEEWSKEFSRFLVRLTEGIEGQRIKVIEVHPPFDTYCDSLVKFLKIYKVFEENILKEFPSTIINIENRYNYDPKSKGGNFIVSKSDDIIELVKLIPEYDVKLKIVVDIPQLLAAHHGNGLLSKEIIKKVLSPLKEIREYISSAHIWGYNINETRGAHDADFNTYFNNDKNLKDSFLREILELFDDDKERYFVPEVSKTSYVESIVSDLRDYGIKFVDPR